MSHHRIAHPQDVPGCFGCRCLGIGFQGLRSRHGPDPVQTTAVLGEDTGKRVGAHHEHWDGRRDAEVFAPSVHLTTAVQERR